MEENLDGKTVFESPAKQLARKPTATIGKQIFKKVEILAFQNYIVRYQNTWKETIGKKFDDFNKQMHRAR